MTLDEAIEHCEEIAEELDMKAGFETDNERYAMSESERKQCKECANDHRQLANWLKELKHLRKQEPCEDAISRKALLKEIENGIKAGNYEEGYEEYPHINDMDDIIECIKYADSVQPKPKTNVLDKIRAEIEQNAYPIVHGVNNHEKGMTLYGILQVIDKYMAESEEQAN